MKIITGLQVAGLTPQQICATIINFAVNRCVLVGEKEYKYGQLAQKEICRFIGDNVDDIAVVTEQTIIKAVEGAQEIVRKCVKVTMRKKEDYGVSLNETRKMVQELSAENNVQDTIGDDILPEQ